MAILENTTDFSTGDQVTAANLNALTESAKFVKAGVGIASNGDTTDETTLDINSDGELMIASLGVKTANIAALAVTTGKIAAGAVTTAKITADAIDETLIADDAVESEHLNDNVISGQTELTAAPDDADEILLSDAGVLKRLGIDTLMKHPALPKAYGIVDFANGAETTKTGDYGVSSVADNSRDNTERNVTLSSPMSSATDYVVMLSIEDQADRQNDWSTTGINVYIDDASNFTIHGAEDDDLRIHFAVFGTLA